MYREMRRKDRLLSEEAMNEIINTAPYGVLSTIGEDGIPYGVPLSYVYKDNNIYFHSAVVGHKLDNIKFNNNVSFCIVTDVENIPDKFSTKYKSVVVFGTVNEVNEEEKEDVFKLILEKFSGNFMESGMDYVKKSGKNAKIFKINIDHISAKGRE